MLRVPYGISNFETLFGKYYIGQHPTPLANSYMVLQFDFSGIDTDQPKLSYQGFVERIKYAFQQFFGTYTAFSEKDIEYILAVQVPSILLGRLMSLVRKYYKSEKIYVLIDEYDHFTNDLMAFRLEEFKDVVGSSGYVRTFYEVIKIATHSGVVDRFFATGVAPVTLDSLTSGFNIGTNISLKPYFNEMMGFTEAEVLDILEGINIPSSEIAAMMKEIRRWYNGYLFDTEGEHRMYNSDMVLYFAKEYQQNQGYPQSLLDTNISSDYSKIGQLFRLGGEEKKDGSCCKSC